MSDVKGHNINYTEVTAKDLPLHCPTAAVAGLTRNLVVLSTRFWLSPE